MGCKAARLLVGYLTQISPAQAPWNVARQHRSVVYTSYFARGQRLAAGLRIEEAFEECQVDY